MGDVNHVENLIVDYSLGLLPYSERQEVERHAATCLSCRRALQREQQIGRMVQETVRAAARPAGGRLGRLMPAVPARRSMLFFARTWQRQLAALCVALILLISSAGLYTSNQPGWRGSAPSFITVTATVTSKPTATLAHTEATSAIDRTDVPTTTAVDGETIPAVMATTIMATPAPEITSAVPSPTPTFTNFAKAIPTPIAAILSLSN